jgi:hypothetical protein
VRRRATSEYEEVEPVRSLLWTMAAASLAAGCTTTAPPEAEMSAARSMLTQAQPVASQYAPGELRAAQAKLERAEALYAREQYTDARLLAEQAEVDAKLAWSIGESERARRALAEVRR